MQGYFLDSTDLWQSGHTVCEYFHNQHSHFNIATISSTYISEMHVPWLLSWNIPFSLHVTLLGSYEEATNTAKLAFGAENVIVQYRTTLATSKYM